MKGNEMKHVSLALLSLAVLLPAPHMPYGSHSCWPHWETVTAHGSWFSVYPGQTQSLDLDGVRHVQNVIIRAHADSYTAGQFEVLVNGDVKGTVYVPGEDPTYVVTVAETASSIEFTNISGGTVDFQGVQAVQSSWSGYPTPTPGSLRGDSNVVDIAQDAIEITEQFETYVLPQEYQQYFLPIKKVAGRLMVYDMGRGDLSSKTAAAMVALRDQIDYAQGFLDQSMERDATFDLSVSLMTLRERIDDLIK